MTLRSVALDFDGVVHAFTSPFTDPLVVPDDPIPGSFDFVRALLSSDVRVWLHTARFMHNIPPHLTAVPEIDLEPRIQAVLGWFIKHGAEDIPQHANFHPWRYGGKPHADVYVDDHAYRFTGTFPALVHLTALKAKRDPRVNPKEGDVLWLCGRVIHVHHVDTGNDTVTSVSTTFIVRSTPIMRTLADWQLAMAKAEILRAAP